MPSRAVAALQYLTALQPGLPLVITRSTNPSGSQTTAQKRRICFEVCLGCFIIGFLSNVPVGDIRLFELGKILHNLID